MSSNDSPPDENKNRRRRKSLSRSQSLGPRSGSKLRLVKLVCRAAAETSPPPRQVQFGYATILMRRTFIRCVQRSRTIRLNCQVHQPVLFPKETFEIPASTHPCDPATRPDAHHRHGNIFEATFPIRSIAPDRGCLLSADTRRSLKA